MHCHVLDFLTIPKNHLSNLLSRAIMSEYLVFLDEEMTTHICERQRGVAEMLWARLPPSSPLCTFASKTADSWRPAQTASHADFFQLFHRFPSFALDVYFSLRHISLLSKYDYNRRILFELTAQTMASLAETCEARLSEESLPPALSPPSPSSTPSSTSTCLTAATVLGCASTGPDRRSDALGWSKAQSAWATVLWETQRRRRAHGAGHGAPCAVRHTACSSVAPSMSCCWPCSGCC